MSYQRFVIISYLRSGTHLLRTTLESHPSIVCQTEIFNSDSRSLPYPLTMPTQEVLDRWVYHDISPEVEHVGFVLQAYHPNALTAFPGIRPNPVWADIWELLAKMPDLKVIHLRRNNLLRRHLSHARARANGQWHNWDSKQLEHISSFGQPQEKHIDQYKGSKAPLVLDANRLKKDFEEVSYWHKKAEDNFSKSKCFHISYEALLDNFNNACLPLLDFLEAKPAPLKSGIRKLESRSLTESIENYEELKQFFSNTQWSHFFED